jgi:hypothetical protein
VAVVEVLRKNGVVILGGDFWLSDTRQEELRPSYENWYVTDSDLASPEATSMAADRALAEIAAHGDEKGLWVVLVGRKAEA